MTMKKLTALLLCLALVAALGGCTASPGPGAETPSPSPSPEVTVPVDASPSPSPSPSEEPEPSLPPEPPAPTVATLAVCGDAMSHMPITNDAWDEEKGYYDYVRIMNGAQAAVSAADYAVVNLETTLSAGPTYTGYPMFSSPDDMARGLKELGFDLCLTANNHCMDKWFSGLCRTLDVLDEVGLAHVGTSRTQEEFDNNIVVADVGGISVAFLGYTYGTNGMPLGENTFAVNLFNTDFMTTLRTPDLDKLSADLDKAKALETDLVAVMIHWGVEYQTTENAYQDEIADYLFEHGADIILGGHAHVPQPMEIRTLADGRQGFVCYSLGNFISSQVYDYTDTTAVLTLELTRDNETGVTQVTGYTYDPMFMFHPDASVSPHYELIDAQTALDQGVDSEYLAARLAKCIQDCQSIFGEAPGLPGKAED